MHVQAGDMQRLMDRLLDYRDKALEVDPEHSGTPEDFITYCRVSWLPAHLSRPFYRAQAQSHVDHLAFPIEGLNRDIERTAGVLLDQRDAAVAEREWLMHELAHYCGIDPSIRHRIDEQREAKAMAAQFLQMRTDALRAKNQAAAEERQHRQNMPSWQRGYRSF